MELFKNYKPGTISDLFLDSDMKSEIKSTFESEIKPRVILINGKAGCGKTVLANLIAKEYYPLLSVFRFNPIEDESISENSGVVILDECDLIPNSIQEKVTKTIKTTDNVYIIISSNTDYINSNLLSIVDSHICIESLDYELLYNGLCKICDKEKIPHSKEGIDCIIGKWDINVRAMLLDIQYINSLGKAITTDGIAETCV